MSYQITNLKKLKITEISGSDLIIVTDVTSSNGLPETKTIKLEELKNYSTSSSNIDSTFRTGSYGINFYGILTGSSDTSSYSFTSSISNYTDYLIYPNVSTSSVSVKSDYAKDSLNSNYSISASISDNCILSLSSSNIVVNNKSVSFSDISLFSTGSITSSLSEKTRYIPYSVNNGIVYHSLYSDKSAYSDFSLELASDNKTTMSVAVNSNYSNHAITASNSDSSSYSVLSTLASKYPNGETFAYITFIISGSSTTDITQLNVEPKVWYNVNNIKLSSIELGNIKGLEISINYQDPVPSGNFINAKADVSPLSTNYTPTWKISDHLGDLASNQLSYDNLIHCWGSSCSSTSGKISLYIYNLFNTSGDTTHQGWAYQSVVPFLTNAIFSFVATTTSTSGSLESPPTTLPAKC